MQQLGEEQSKRKIIFQEKPQHVKKHKSKWNIFGKQSNVSSVHPIEEHQVDQQPINTPQNTDVQVLNPESTSPILKKKESITSKFLKQINLIRKFFRKKTNKKVDSDPALSKEQIKKKFLRARAILRTIFALNKISEEIIIYGTSSNLFDLSTRDRKALKRYLFPLLYKDTDFYQSDLVEFPLIHPKSALKICWNPILFLLMLYTATLLPYRTECAFGMTKLLMMGGTYLTLQLLSSIGLISSLICLVHIMMTKYYTYMNIVQGKLVRTKKEVINNYLKSWFVVDFLASLPAEEIFLAAIGSEGESAKIRLVKLARIPKLWRLARITKIIKFLRHYSSTDLFDFFEFNAGVIRLINLFFTFSLTVHLFACLWNYIAYLDSENLENWVYRGNFSELQPFSLYIVCIYFAMTGLTTVGYGDIVPKTIPEMIIVMIWMIIGVGFYSGAIGILTSVLANMDQKSNTIQRKVAIMSEFCREMKIKKDLQEKMKKVLEYNAHRNCFTWCDSQQLFADLPIALQNEIIINIHDQVVNELQFFKISEDKVFAIRVFPLLKTFMLNENEYVWQKGNTAEGVYLLITGRVIFLEEFRFAHDQKKKLVGFKSMINGSYFGEIEIILKRKRDFYVQCEQNCDFYLLERIVLENLISQEFPSMFKKLKLIAEERVRRNNSTVNEIGDIIEKINQRNQIQISQEDVLSRKSSKQFSKVIVPDDIQKIEKDDQQQNLLVPNEEMGKEEKKEIITSFSGSRKMSIPPKPASVQIIDSNKKLKNLQKQINQLKTIISEMRDQKN